MNYASVVGFGNRLADRMHNRDHPFYRELLLFDQFGFQWMPREKFHGDICLARWYQSVFISRYYVWVNDSHCRFCFACEPANCYLVGYKFAAQDLESHVAIAAKIEGAIDYSHSTMPYLFDYLVAVV